MKVSRFCLVSIVLLVMVLFFSMQAHADLELLGQGMSVHGTYNLIYDTAFDITWYDYTNFDDTWQNQLDWADALSVTTAADTYNDWRLPTTVDVPWVWGYDGTTSGGYNITSSEMGHLFYTELGNKGYYATDGTNPQTGWGLTNTGDFQNLQSSRYWAGPEYSTNTDYAWDFDFISGNQSNSSKDHNDGDVLAVMSGRAVVPEPISSTLFIVGGATLGLRRFWKKTRTA